MNKIVYSLFALCLLCLAGCTQEIPDNKPDKDGNVTVNFTVATAELKTIATRANGGVNDMNLLIFDENGSFIARRQATLSAQTDEGGLFTVELPVSSKKRAIHFVSNYNWSGFDDNSMFGVNETGVMTSLNTTTIAFWTRVALNSGISENSFTGETVELLRNQAKISVANEDPAFTYEGFTIHKAPASGTITPYNINSPFETGTITEPAGVTLSNAVQTGINSEEKYLFERKNASAQEITTVILKGLYEGQHYFYKIDLIDADKNRYDIERNYHYLITIRTVTRAGYSSFEDALNGASHNNTALDPIIEKYPMISDGISKLEVEKTLVVLTEPGQPMNVWYKYFPDINTSAVNNDGVSVSLQSNDEALSPGSFSYSSGAITANALPSLPEEPKQSTIIVSTGDLARTIRVVLRKPFNFNSVTINNQSPATLVIGQGRDATLRFNIPDDYPEDLLPLPVKIYTQGLYSSSTGLEIQVEAGVIHYIYRASSRGMQTVRFKTNKSNNSETVRLQADYFTNGVVSYQAN